ncbi:helix-hairpin-helix domain-containing protein [Clostridium aciditolerans]|uniref:Helix-hairpin-helix domain-containing protein n=1 Tax=Clostridium aciditolerans TaxID=339861 RepID=A0A934HUX5_9CLOT|nr:helix-hairpin-helix domain-containing protein [Clostridium aciditolerans]MBI6874760.1 helix-hairpin-helix domain-containing protein [Clostridium aciditolerans]
MIISFETIKEICKRHECDDLYFYENIPLKKLRNARESFKIPKTSAIIALYDNTIFGSCKDGLAICSDGLYWRHASNCSNVILWDDLDSVCFNTKDHYLILNNFYNIDIYGDYRSKMLAEFLLDIKDHIYRDSAPKEIILKSEKNISQKTSEKEILESNNTKQRKNESDKNSPKSTNSKSSIGILKDNQPKNKLTNINNASLDQLIDLPYFTLERAEKILSERKNNVIFTCLDDIIDILNLKPHEAEDLKEYLSFKTSSLKKNSAKREVVKKSEEIINDNINNPLKGRIVDY